MVNKMTYSAIEEKILNTFCIKSSDYSKLNSSKTSSKYKETHYDELSDMLEYINNYSEDTNNLCEVLYMIKNHIKSRPKCANPDCNNHSKFISFSKGYSTFCSHKCNMKSEITLNKFKHSIDEKNIKRNIFIDRYLDWSTISDECDNRVLYLFVKYKKTNRPCIDGNKLDINKQWCKKNENIIKYVQNRFSDSTSIEENVYRLYHHIEHKPVCKTCGKQVKFISFSSGYSNFCSHRCKSLNNDVRQKTKATIKMLNELNPNRKQLIKSKRIQTYKQHLCDGTLPKFYTTENTIFLSTSESDLLNKLTKLYGSDDVLIHYRDERYKRPWDNYCWECDFYIKSIDVFIECQIFPTHGKHPYDKKSVDDKAELRRLKQLAENLRQQNGKTKNIYDDTVYIWTIGDTQKRNVAKKNNLNYIEIFNSIPDITELSNIINSSLNTTLNT